jgi:hypothetical protein
MKMEDKRMRVKIFIIIFFFWGILNAKISPESAKLEELRMKVEKCPTETNMCFYLNSFPSSFKKFKFIFYGQKDVFDELYDKHEEHLNLLWNLSKKYPKKVLAIWLSIAKDVDEDGYADAIGILQLQLARYGSENPKQFSEALKKENKKDLLSIIRFMADMENHKQYHDYIKLLEKLKELNFIDLFNMFYEARKERMKYRHD